MKRSPWVLGLLLAACALAPAPASAKQGGFGVEVWTDRGNEAVYQPGDVMQLRARASEDSYLLVYEIDSDGYVRVLYPYRGDDGEIRAKQTYHVPSDDADVELVVEKETGQGYIVAIASRDPFRNLPRYLRPYDVQADEIGYVNEPSDDDEGIDQDGRIVGDPYVAMERIRRRVLQEPKDEDSFGTSYTSYYVHEQVRYPRYICNDCHRSNHWAWWDGFDPYYTRCSVVDFRVNWSWNWGPTCWNGFVPYYVYVARNDCPPRWRFSNPWLSSWDGWGRFCRTWNGPLNRYKTPPPPGYVPPTRYANWRTGATPPPPGFIASNYPRFRNPPSVGRGDGASTRETLPGRTGVVRPTPLPVPVREGRGTGERGTREGEFGGRRESSPTPAERPREPNPPSERRTERPQPAPAPPRAEPPREQRGREERPADPPRQKHDDQPQRDRGETQRQRQDTPREEGQRKGHDRG